MEDLLFAFRFFTNIPVPGAGSWQESRAARSLGWLPLTGLAVGLFQAGLYLIMEQAGWLPLPAAQAALLLLAGPLAGGWLFIDGFCDTCDGLLARRGREETLSIMGDSRLGALGAAGLVLYFITKFAFYRELAEYGDFLPVLLYEPVLARFAVSLTACVFPTARAEGLAVFFKKEQQPGDLLLAALLTGALGLVLPPYLRPAPFLALAGAFGAAGLIQRRLRGHTGDTYGFVALVTEQMFLAAVLMRLF